MKFKKFFMLTLPFMFSLPALAEKMKGGAIGSGISYGAPNQALFVNPAGLLSAEKMSFEAMYLIDPENFHASVVGIKGNIGLGAGWRQSGDANIFEGGLALSLGSPKLGVTLRTVDGDGLDADFGLSWDLSKMRLSVVGRGVEGGFERVDVGLGFMVGSSAILEFDAKKPLPLDSDSYLFDVALSLVAGNISVGVGYDFSYVANEFVDGGIHAGLSYAASSQLYIEGYYRPMSQEWGAGEWTAGIRYMF